MPEGQDELAATFWTLHACREAIRGTMAAMCSIDAYPEYSAAFQAVQAAMDKISEEEVTRENQSLRESLAKRMRGGGV